MTDLRTQLLAEKARIGMTNAELARALGVAPPTVTKMLRADNDMTLSTAERLAAALKSAVKLVRVKE